MLPLSAVVLSAHEVKIIAAYLKAFQSKEEHGVFFLEYLFFCFRDIHVDELCKRGK